jgi:DNA-directed RNA polymerase subunit RPC12/RpoP
MRCLDCGAEISAGLAECPSCGARADVADRVWGHQSVRRIPGDKGPYFRLSYSTFKLEAQRSTFVILCAMVMVSAIIVGAFIAQTALLMGLMVIVLGFLIIGLWYFFGVLR